MPRHRVKACASASPAAGRSVKQIEENNKHTAALMERLPALEANLKELEGVGPKLEAEIGRVDASLRALGKENEESEAKRGKTERDVVVLGKEVGGLPCNIRRE